MISIKYVTDSDRTFLQEIHIKTKHLSIREVLFECKKHNYSASGWNIFY